MGDDYAECPVCQCRLSTSLLERHVNLHLDEDDFDRDQAVARQVASTPEPILQCTGLLAKSLRAKVGWQKFIKRGVHTLKKQDYQVCYVEPGIAEGEELEQYKVLNSECHSY
eukprot:c24505_g1_i1 orf=233-568(+)